MQLGTGTISQICAQGYATGDRHHFQKAFNFFAFFARFCNNRSIFA